MGGSFKREAHRNAYSGDAFASKPTFTSEMRFDSIKILVDHRLKPPQRVQREKRGRIAGIVLYFIGKFKLFKHPQHALGTGVNFEQKDGLAVPVPRMMPCERRHEKPMVALSIIIPLPPRRRRGCKYGSSQTREAQHK
jgi:hypothetical protein